MSRFDETARVYSVGRYEDPSLRQKIEEFLGEDPELIDWLAQGDPQRLVVVKPNWIQEAHEYQSHIWEPVITHPAVVLAVIESLAASMRGRGTIAVCDAPHAYADFEAIVRRGGFDQGCERIRERFPELRLEILDLRREFFIRKEEVVIERRPNTLDPRGYVKLNLGMNSLFYGRETEGRYYGADYDTRVVNQHHSGSVHEYLLAGTPMRCDLFVNVPKLKTHKKTGITCSLKNLVGINGDKNYLPHHTEGTPRSGGDEFRDERWANSLEGNVKRFGRMVVMKLPFAGTWFYRKMRNVGKSVLGDSETSIRNGNWEGNDTCWRMALDLNRALLFGCGDGTWRGAERRGRYLSIVDGIVGGEGNGPLCPESVESGVLICGWNPATVDAVACRVMGYDPSDLPIVLQAFATHPLPIVNCRIDDICVLDERLGAQAPLSQISPALSRPFRPHFGWTSLARNDVMVCAG